MNKIKGLTIALAIVGVFGTNAFANPTFEPLNFDDANHTSNSAISAKSVTVEQSAQNADLTGNVKMQSAISALDNAQVEVRNELLNYRTQFAEVDAKYVKIKAERSALSKQVKATEKRIKEIDRAKEKIKKNMM